MKPKATDRETASRINPVIGYASLEDTLCSARNVIDDVALRICVDTGVEGPEEGLALILNVVSAALRYEIENPGVAHVANVTPITA